MAYELVEIVDGYKTSRANRMNYGKTFETKELAMSYMQSLLDAPKLGFVSSDIEHDDENDAIDIAAFTKSQIRQFAIQPGE